MLLQLEESSRLYIMEVGKLILVTNLSVSRIKSYLFTYESGNFHEHIRSS